MATTIVFAGTTGQRSLSVTVKEDVDQVFKAWREAAGLPFDLTKSESSEAKIWINPLTVAYWHETWRSGRESFA